MPRIRDSLLDTVFYLYPSRAAAERGKKIGGTGFLIAVESKADPSEHWAFGVSNKHVVHTDGCSVARLNRLDGTMQIFELEPHEWIEHPDGDDVAIVPFAIDTDVHRAKGLGRDMFITKELIGAEDIGPGDNVFMVGRFINHEGKQQNDPSVRFGNISVMPKEKIRQTNGFLQESFAVEMRSMAGYSGSPVFIFKDGPTVGEPRILRWLTPGQKPKLWLLGIDWGHIVDDWPVRSKIVDKTQVQALSPTEAEVQYVRANTGMNGVVPAWKLADLLNHKTIIEYCDTMDQNLRKKKSRERGGTEFDSAAPAPSDEANPNHLEDFTRLVDVAARKRPQDG